MGVLHQLTDELSQLTGLLWAVEDYHLNQEKLWVQLSCTAPRVPIARRISRMKVLNRFQALEIGAIVKPKPRRVRG